MQLTLRDLDVLCKRKKLNDQRIEAPIAQLSTMYYNAHRPEGVTAKSLEDLMFTKMVPVSKGRIVQTEEQMKSIAILITKAFNGEMR